MTTELVRLVTHYLLEDIKEQRIYQSQVYPFKAKEVTYLDPSTGLSVEGQSRWEDTY